MRSVQLVSLSVLSLVSWIAAAPPPQQPHIAGASAVCPITRVVDGDTVWVRRGEKEDKLRLLCVDTEETIKKGPSDPSKPQTVFGDETMHWARALFSGLDAADGQADGVTHIGLAFPGGVEKRDSFGRLLCHVLLPDGEDYNLRLVREGWSPYFNKYGNSELAHAAFLAAQREARAAKRGVWNPATNRPAEVGAPTLQRAYDELLPWWDARAAAIGAFLARVAQREEGLFDAEDPASIAAAQAWCEKHARPATLFGSFDAHHVEADGSHTLVFRGPDKKLLLRATASAGAWAGLAALDLDARVSGKLQNYVYVRGLPQPHERGGAALRADQAEQWQIAAPEYRGAAAASPAAGSALGGALKPAPVGG